MSKQFIFAGRGKCSAKSTENRVRGARRYEKSGDAQRKAQHGRSVPRERDICQWPCRDTDEASKSRIDPTERHVALVPHDEACAAQQGVVHQVNVDVYLGAYQNVSRSQHRRRTYDGRYASRISFDHRRRTRSAHADTDATRPR